MYFMFLNCTLRVASSKFYVYFATIKNNFLNFLIKFAEETTTIYVYIFFFFFFKI